MKIETAPIIELDNFVALRSKSYFLVMVKRQHKRQGKGQFRSQNKKEYNIHHPTHSL